MKRNPPNRPEPADLRRRAEDSIDEGEGASGQIASGLDPDFRRVFHELEVHQVELEMQNEELRRARSEVEVGLERYTELFDFAPIGYLTLERDSTIREANLAGARLLGVERGRLAGRRFVQFVREEQRREICDFIRQVMERREDDATSASCEVALGGELAEHDVHLTASVLRGPRAFVALEGITRRKRAEEALVQEARNKDRFLAVLSHELRNPLAPIRNSLFVLERADPGGGRAREAQAVIGRQVTHLTRIVEDLLDVTRIAQGKIRIEAEPLELDDVARRTIEDHRLTFAESGVVLESHLPAKPLWVSGDATRLAQVLGNILGNAVKFTPRGGTVAVRLTREGGEAVLSVRDTGVGIDPEMQGRLFEPFMQAPQTIDRTLGGLGLGLAMVKELVELHGGEVAVASVGQGHGSTFTVRLPLGAAPVQAVAAPVASEMRRHRILVIDDSVNTADSLRDVLAEEGQEVRVANDGSKGITLAREFRPQIVICDVGLPGMDGYAVARAFRADPSLKGSYLIALSGYARAEDRQRARDAGFDRHLAKPTSLESLEQILQEAPAPG